MQDDPYDRPAIEEVLEQLKELQVLDKPLDYDTLEQSQVTVSDIQNDVVKKLNNKKRTNLPEMHQLLTEKEAMQPKIVSYLPDNEVFLELHFYNLNFTEGKCVVTCRERNYIFK